ncbi:penicillin-binding protein 2 [Thalassobius sp. I31.1]|uniref:peptidoglycan D,D-transpeptidase FtsI family protein n=1 Tax=Thalassobius sp. I31.1 TaxID=2109912 RepID=UPI000D19A4FE|nr:penicillin-binding protein 2 [Thalassobius sp. I31.1]
MIRTPLRPLARILSAREQGENPDRIERDNIRARHDDMQGKARQRAEGRLLVLSVLFLAAFSAVGLRMGSISVSAPQEPRSGGGGDNILAQRADITDRNGHILATNIATYALYAHPQQMIDPVGAAARLAEIFPELDHEQILRQFTGERKFVWVRQKLSPEQRQAVHDIGEPGLLFGPREMRLYPNGALAAHVMGGASFGREGVNSAEVIGVAGVEQVFDETLRDPANNGAPLVLSLDMTVQAVAEEVLDGGMQLMSAKGASSVLMDIHTGEVISVVSLPDFDPNERPRPLTEGDQSDSPLFNRAVQGVYELGSTYKLFALAQGIEEGLINANTMIDTQGPMQWGRFKIRDFHDYGPQLTATDVLVKSSNIGTARIALMFGGERQRAFLASMGLTEPSPLEIIEASGSQPLLPPNWSELSTMTISYGHGISASPMHLAAAYATMVNGGTRVTPTLLRQDNAQTGPRVISEQTSRIAVDMLRQVVTRGTASFGDVEGYEVGGKTGSADKPRPNGGYYDDKVISTFASVFPASDPQYVLIVTLDEPSIEGLGEVRRTAGWTAVPVAAEMTRRVAPLLGLRPQIETPALTAVTLSSN